MQRVILVQQISLLPEHIKSTSRGDFLCVFAFVNAGFQKVSIQLQNHLAVTYYNTGCRKSHLTLSV